ncbi:MAG: hypothetical protein IKH28_04005 [Lachnospiraceae bacterium]|nr:hypothetical protein [Lachnospiraceae bacterium]
MEENKELESKKMNDGQAKDAAGGYYVGNPDKYTIEEYNKWGVTWESNFWSKDRYFVYGKSISQEEAEKIVDESVKRQRRLTEDELGLLGISGF